MRYDSQKHHRKSIRLQEYDYSQIGVYFITICTQDKKCLFGEIINGTMFLSDAGVIVEQCLSEIPTHFPHATIGEFAIMPNHIHFIVHITDTVGANNHSPPPPVETNANDDSCVTKTGAGNDSRVAKTGAGNDSRVAKTGAGNDSRVAKTGANNYSCVAKTGANNYSPLRGTSRTVGSIVRGVKIGVTKQLVISPWQRNYYEHIIRDDDDYRRIVEYITNNPKNWRNDKLWIE